MSVTDMPERPASASFPAGERAQEPADIYHQHLGNLHTTRANLRRRDARLGYTKLFLLTVSLGLGVWIVADHVIAAEWILLPVAVLVFAFVLHDRVLRAIVRCDRAISFYQRGLARVENRWIGTGESGERFLDPAHPYARDLDLFGKGSVFELLCAARTRAGEETLARWLLAAAPPDEVRARHAAIADLCGRLTFREDLAVLGEDVRAIGRPELLAQWGTASTRMTSSALRLALAALTALWLSSFVAWAVWNAWGLVVMTSLLNAIVTNRLRLRFEASITDIENATPDLKVLSAVLARIEREEFSASGLAALRSRFVSGGMRASGLLARLDRLVESLRSRRHLLLVGIDRFIFWSFQFELAIEAWRKNHGHLLGDWLTALGESEALSDIAGYAYEHPEDTFPEFTDESPCFDAKSLAHPLLPEGSAVRNDICLGTSLRLVIISGPNMAGKSTFLRAVGVNAVLAQCGAPVRAEKLRLSPITVAASVCVLDSLQGGISRFYAEITRLKLITDLTAGPAPVLALLDELLQGTNSHDRRIGAEAIVRGLYNRGAIEIVTTHDLALAQIAASLGSTATNAHFEDRLENGKLIFDYRLSPGIVQTSNALGLMRSIGLDV